MHPMQEIRSVCVFCASSDGHDPALIELAREVGRALAFEKIRLVYGGGGRGLMGALSSAALDAGGEVVGIIPRAMTSREGIEEHATEVHIVRSMHERKALMEQMSDAFITLPGGFGTFEELFEMVTWQQLGIHRKPIAVINRNGFYDPLLGLIEKGVGNGFIGADASQGILICGSAAEAIARLRCAEIPPAFPFIWSDET